jgi:hypothetical protein
MRPLLSSRFCCRSCFYGLHSPSLRRSRVDLCGRNVADTAPQEVARLTAQGICVARIRKLLLDSVSPEPIAGLLATPDFKGTKISGK